MKIGGSQIEVQARGKFSQTNVHTKIENEKGSLIMEDSEETRTIEPGEEMNETNETREIVNK